MLSVSPPNSQCSCHTRNAKDRFGSEAVLMPFLKAAYDDYLADGLGFKVAPGHTFVLGKLNPAAPLQQRASQSLPRRPRQRFVA